MADEPEPVLTREELEQLKRRLALLSDDAVQTAYVTAHSECRFDGQRVPPPAALQQLVTAWKVLRQMCRGK
jgi:hypothetical protein